MRIGILTGGGDTAALNATLYGVVTAAAKHGHKVLGFEEGWKGILGEANYTTLSVDHVKPRWGGTMLRTSRTKLKDEDGTLDEAVANIERNTDAFIAVGGDDTLSVAMAIKDRLKNPFIAITKTIDNDVGTNSTPADNEFETMLNYFTPGFPTAATRICEYVNQLRTTAYSHKRVMLLESMGRKPGWLALASSMADPDLIVVPEFPIDFEQFKDKVVEKYNDGCKNYCVAVIAEGSRYKDGSLVSVDESKVDAFGNTQLGGASEVLARRLKKDLAGLLGHENFNSVNPGYLYRSGNPSVIDLKYAVKLGEKAVEGILRGETAKAAVVQREDGDFYTELIPVASLVKMDAKGHILPRLINERFYDPLLMCATESARSYLRPLQIN